MLVGVKGSLASLGGVAALDPACAPCREVQLAMAGSGAVLERECSIVRRVHHNDLPTADITIDVYGKRISDRDPALPR